MLKKEEEEETETTTRGQKLFVSLGVAFMIVGIIEIAFGRDPFESFVLGFLCFIITLLDRISWVLESDPIDNPKRGATRMALGTLKRIIRVLEGYNRAAERFVVAHAGRGELGNSFSHLQHHKVGASSRKVCTNLRKHLNSQSNSVETVLRFRRVAQRATVKLSVTLQGTSRAVYNYPLFQKFFELSLRQALNLIGTKRISGDPGVKNFFD